jgi:hypothetical protein
VGEDCARDAWSVPRVDQDPLALAAQTAAEREEADAREKEKGKTKA